LPYDDSTPTQTSLHNLPINKEVPEVGDTVYVPNYFPEGKGIEHKHGGWATVHRVVKGYINDTEQHWICVSEFNISGPCELRWEGDLKEKQKELAQEFGLQRAYSKPKTDFKHNYQIARYRI
jgi:hypothetical protein